MTQKNASWNDEHLAWRDKDEALDALRACQESGEEVSIGAVLLVDKTGNEEWEEATLEDTESEGQPWLWQIMDEGLNAVLVPQEAYDRNEDFDDLPVGTPEGLVWIIP